LYGLSKEEVIGKQELLELITKIDNNTVNEIALNNTFVKDFEIKLQAKTGEELCISASLLNIEDNTPCIIVVSVDYRTQKPKRA
jgi:hypothetical protein